MSFVTVSGLLAGSMTDPAALAATNMCGSEALDSLLRNGLPVDHADAHSDRPGLGGGAVRKAETCKAA